MKNRKASVSQILGYILPVVIFLGLSYLFISSITQCIYYNEVFKNPAYVDAEVTLHTEEEDSEGDTTYVAYVSYQFGDTYCKNIRYRSGNKIPPIGAKLQLAVDPDDPATLLDKVDCAFFAVSSGGALCIFFAILLRELRRRKLTQGFRGTVEPEVLERDLQLIIWARIPWVMWLLITVLIAVLKLSFPVLFGEGYWIAAAITGGFLLISMTNTVIAAWKVHKGLYEIHQDQLVDKKERSDSEDTTYTLYYQSGKRTWQQNVTAAKFYRARVGSSVSAVYLQGCRKPIMHYDQLGNAAE